MLKIPRLTRLYVIPEPRLLSQEDPEFNTSLGYAVSPKSRINRDSVWEEMLIYQI